MDIEAAGCERAPPRRRSTSRDRWGAGAGAAPGDAGCRASTGEVARRSPAGRRSAGRAETEQAPRRLLPPCGSEHGRRTRRGRVRRLAHTRIWSRNPRYVRGVGPRTYYARTSIRSQPPVWRRSRRLRSWSNRAGPASARGPSSAWPSGLACASSPGAYMIAIPDGRCSASLPTVPSSRRGVELVGRAGARRRAGCSALSTDTGTLGMSWRPQAPT